MASDIERRVRVLESLLPAEQVVMVVRFVGTDSPKGLMTLRYGLLHWVRHDLEEEDAFVSRAVGDLPDTGLHVLIHEACCGST